MFWKWRLEAFPACRILLITEPGFLRPVSVTIHVSVGLSFEGSIPWI